MSELIFTPAKFISVETAMPPGGKHLLLIGKTIKILKEEVLKCDQRDVFEFRIKWFYRGPVHYGNDGPRTMSAYSLDVVSFSELSISHCGHIGHDHESELTKQGIFIEPLNSNKEELKKLITEDFYWDHSDIEKWLPIANKE